MSSSSSSKNYLNKFKFLNNYAWKILSEKDLQQTLCNWGDSIEDSFFHATNYEGVDFYMYSEQIEKFGNHLLLKKGLQEVTREGHKKAVSIMFKRLETENPTNEQLQEHLIWMYAKKYSHSYIANTIKTVEYFSEFNHNPLKLAKTRRPKTLIKDYLTEAEIALMIRFTNNLREKAIITLLAYSGIRNKEFCNLKVEDIDFGNSQIMIRNGKNSKDRRINIGARCSNILVEYIMKYQKQKEDYLFTTILKNNQYATSDLRKLVKIIAKRTRIQKRVYPHLFRHSLATNLLIRGANIFLIKDQLGHSEITTTCEYINRLPYHIKNEYEKFIPSYL